MYRQAVGGVDEHVPVFVAHGLAAPDVTYAAAHFAYEIGCTHLRDDLVVVAALGKFEDAVLVLRPGDGGVPREITGFDRSCVEGDLHAAVAHFAGVDDGTGVAAGGIER